jgi:glycosyltransferase involved in cell wall biosynthesis
MLVPLRDPRHQEVSAMSGLSIPANADHRSLRREQLLAKAPLREAEEQPPTTTATARQRRPKVLVANKFFFLNGGSEAVMFQEMALMRDHGLDVIEFAMDDPRNRPSEYARYFVSPKDYRTATRIDQLKSALALIRSREAIGQIDRLIEEQRPDILHCHNIYHQLTPSIINVAARHHLPVVLTLHDYKPLCPVYTQLANGQVCTKCANGGFEAVLLNRCAEGSLARSALLWAEARYHALARSYHHVTKFIAPSRFMRDAIAQRFGDDKVTYIRNAIDASGLEPSEAADTYVL